MGTTKTPEQEHTLVCKQKYFAVLNGSGKLVMDSIIETEAATILRFIRSVRGQLHVTVEEGTWAAWLYDRLKPTCTSW